jgi:hypothetical protein
MEAPAPCTSTSCTALSPRSRPTRARGSHSSSGCAAQTRYSQLATASEVHPLHCPPAWALLSAPQPDGRSPGATMEPQLPVLRILGQARSSQDGHNAGEADAPTNQSPAAAPGYLPPHLQLLIGSGSTPQDINRAPPQASPARTLESVRVSWTPHPYRPPERDVTPGQQATPPALHRTAPSSPTHLSATMTRSTPYLPGLLPQPVVLAVQPQPIRRRPSSPSRMAHGWPAAAASGGLPYDDATGALFAADTAPPPVELGQGGVTQPEELRRESIRTLHEMVSGTREILTI